jgi:hypothetical protein
VTDKKPKKLSVEARKLAGDFIAEEVRTVRYPRKQAVAVGLSRARAAASELRRKAMISAIMARYR